MAEKKKKFTDAQLEKAMRKVYQMYRRRPNFTGADIGYRWDGETKTKELVVRVHVDVKLPLAELNDADIFPQEVEGVPLDVIEGDYKQRRSAGAPTDRAPILTGGLSVGRQDNSAGTLGGIVMVEDNGVERPAILSNWHVLAGANARKGDPILQPGRADGGSFGDEVANLSDWKLNRFCDAAVAALNGVRPWLPVQNGGFTAFEGTRNSRLDEVLVKHGRTTGKTKARVDGEGIYRIFYEVRPGVIEPRDIEGFKLVPEDAGNPGNLEVSEGGDSGSIWYNENDRNAVGLHFAGETDTDPLAERAIACNMPKVLEQLNARLATFDDLVAFAETALAFTRTPATQPRAELTPRPDMPWPWPCPPYPPFPPLPGPRPGPWDWRVFEPLKDPRDFASIPMPAIGQYTAQKTSSAPTIARSYATYRQMLTRLELSLVDTFGPSFSPLNEGEAIAARLPIHWDYEIARAVADRGHFHGVLEYYPTAVFYEDAVIWAHVADKLTTIALDRG